MPQNFLRPLAAAFAIALASAPATSRSSVTVACTRRTPSRRHVEPAAAGSTHATVTRVTTGGAVSATQTFPPLPGVQ